MEHYLPIGGILLFILTSIVYVKTEITKRPTWDDTKKTYVPKGECNIITKDFNKKLDCIPEMKDAIARIETKLDIWIGKNGGNSK